MGQPHTGHNAVFTGTRQTRPTKKVTFPRNKAEKSSFQQHEMSYNPDATPDTSHIGRGTHLLKNTTNTGHNELLHQDPLQPPLEPRPGITKPPGPNWGRAAVAVALGFEPRVAVTPHSISSAAPSAARTRYLTRILYYTNPPTTQIDHPRWEQSHTPKPESAHPHAQAATRSLPTHHDHHDHHERQAVPARPDSARQRSGSSCDHIQEHPNNTPLSPTTPQAPTQRSKKQPRACPEPGHPHQHQDPIVKAYLNDTPLIIGSATRLHYAGRVPIQRSERNIRVCATCD